MWKIYNIWCTCFPVQTLVQLPCGEILAFSYQCPCEKCRRAPCGSVEVKGGGMGRHQEASVCGHLGLSSQGEVSRALGRKALCSLQIMVGPFRPGGIPHTVGRTLTFLPHPTPTGPSLLQKHVTQPAYWTAEVAKGKGNILRKRNFHQDNVCSLPQSLGVSAFLLLCRAHLHQTSLVC